MKQRLLELLALAALSTGALHSQDLAATWQGTVQIGPEQRRVSLEVANSPSGWFAKSFYVEYFPDEVRVDSLALTSSELNIKFNNGKGVYQATLSPDGSNLAGTWTYDHTSMPLDLHRVTAQTAWATPFHYQYHYKTVTIARPSQAEPRIPFSPELALDYMEQGAAAWTGERQCVACHTNGSYMVVRPLLTQQLGPPQQELREFFVKSLQEELAIDPADMRPELDSTQAVYVAAGLAIWDANVTHHLSPETEQALDMMFKLQRKDGDWTISDDNNPPLESSRYQLATVAARAVGNAPGWLARQHGHPVEAKVNLLVSYLRSDRKMQADYDRTDLLWAATEFPGLLDRTRMTTLVDMILKHQKPDGGWSIRSFAGPEDWGKGNRAPRLRAESDLADPPSDGHMTGLAIIALRKAGLPAGDPRIQRGLHWILTNQRASGRWWTRSLNTDNWQFISYSSTIYSLLALGLCDALPSSVTEYRSQLATWQ